MAERVEYRVCWQREGMSRRRAIYQTRRGAEEKVEALLWSDEAGDPDDPYEREFADIPPLAGGPHIEAREVGEWNPLPANGEGES